MKMEGREMEGMRKVEKRISLFGVWMVGGRRVMMIVAHSMRHGLRVLLDAVAGSSEQIGAL